MSRLTDRIAELAKPAVEAAGCRLWDVEYVREAGTWYLRVTIDKDGGVSIDDCEKVHRTIDPLLDEADPNSSKDFGKNVIHNLLRSGERLYAYPFSGYWKDVGTVSSLWEANMDLLADSPELNLSDKNFRIYSKNTARPPQFVGSGAVIRNSMISEGCVIHGHVENSVISGGVEIARDAFVSNSVILADVKIESGAAQKAPDLEYIVPAKFALAFS